jgi:hypothetical protein
VTEEKTPNAPRLPETEEALAELLDRVDQQLVREGVPIHARELRAVMAIGTEFSIPIPLTPPIPGAEHPSFQYWWLTQKIYEWYRRRYGDRLKVDFAPGRTVFLLRGDSWVIKLPRLYGTVRFVVSRAPRPACTNQFWTQGQTATHNVLDSVEELPDGLREALTEAEMGTVGSHFMRGYAALSAMEDLGRIALVAAAKSDSSASVDHIAGSHPDFALAKWASLQVAEKLIKATMGAAGLSYDRIHDLDKLASHALQRGLALGLDDLLSPLRCTPAIRYGQQEVTVDEAVAAHHAALDVTIRLAPRIAELTARKP